MWHLQTKLGTFWIVDSEEKANEFLLGMDNDVLGAYIDPDAAVHDVQNHETGCLRWDTTPLARPTPALPEWRVGAPNSWEQ